AFVPSMAVELGVVGRHHHRRPAHRASQVLHLLLASSAAFGTSRRYAASTARGACGPSPSSRTPPRSSAICGREGSSRRYRASGGGESSSSLGARDCRGSLLDAPIGGREDPPAGIDLVGAEADHPQGPLPRRGV